MMNLQTKALIICVLVQLICGAFSVACASKNIFLPHDQAVEETTEQDKEAAAEQDKEAAAVELKIILIENNKQYVVIIVGMFAFTLVIISYLMKITPHQAKDLITIIGLAAVIFATLILVLIVDTTEALTAPIGILGAIAGYLFGTAHKKDA